MADIRSFFGGARPVKKEKASDAPAPAAAAASSATAGESIASGSKKKPTADASEKAKASPKKSKGKAAKANDGKPSLVMDPPAEGAAAKKPRATSKKKKATADDDDDVVDTTDEKTKKPASTKKATAKKSAPVAAAEAEVKSPHFSPAPAVDSPPAPAASTAATTTKQKKRIRDDDDDDDFEIVEKKPDMSDLTASPSKKPVVIRREASPAKKKADVTATSASAFFGAATVAQPTNSMEKLKATVEAKQRELARQKLENEQKAQMAKLKQLEEEEARERQEREERETQEAIAQVAAAEAAAAAASADKPKIVINAPPATNAPMETDDGSDIEEIAKPTLKSPLVSPAKAKSPIGSPLRKSPAASPTPKSPFKTFSPSAESHGSLSAHAAPVHASPQKSPEVKTETPKKAIKTEPAKSPTRPKLTAAKRVHAAIESAAASFPPAASAPSASVKMEDVNDFGGASLQTNADAFAKLETEKDEAAIVDPSPAKKQKVNTGAAVPVPASGEKKKFNPYKAPAQPANLGSKEIPIAKPGCLTGLTFVLTGTGDAFSREDMTDLIQKYGGKCTSAVSGKTDYLVAGLDPGESKLKKAVEKKTKIINEDDVLQLLRDKSKGWSGASAAASASANGAAAAPASRPIVTVAAGVPLPKPQLAVPLAAAGSAAEQAIMRSGLQTASNVNEMLWVDAHRPMKITDIIGNPGLVKQINDWLSTWHSKRIARETTGTEKDRAKAIKALLISGPPGIGKSTAATLIARHLGFEVLEFNASDTRNKRALQEVVGDITGNRGITEFYNATTANGNAPATQRAKSKPNVIIFDEVDGMGGNEDRGGMQELVSLIKSTRTPIICIANDVSLPKMKTLKNYCECLTWRRVPAAQIATKMLDICKKEGLTIDIPTLTKLAESTQGDIRQVLNFLQMQRKANTAVSFDEMKKRMENAGKDFDLGPFDVVPGFFKPIPPAQPGKPHDWIGDRQNMYFVDSDIIPLFIADNYLSGRAVTTGLAELKSNQTLVNRTRSMPDGQKVLNDVLAMGQIAEAADSISMADLLSDSMYTEQDYTLMPSHAVLSTIYPAYLMRGGFSERLAFPAWLGKQSSRNKWLRIAKELRITLTLDIRADSYDTILYVLPLLRMELLNSLAHPPDGDTDAGIERVIALMDHFGIDKDEFDLLMEWGGKLTPAEQSYATLVPSSVKTKFTRAWKSGTHMRKVSHGGKGDAGEITRRRGGAAFKESTDDGDEDEDEEGEGEGEEMNGEGDGEPKPEIDLSAAVAGGKGKGGKAALAAGLAKPKKAPAAKKEGAPKKPRAPRKQTGEGAAASKKKKRTAGSDDDDDDDF